MKPHQKVLLENRIILHPHSIIRDIDICRKSIQILKDNGWNYSDYNPDNIRNHDSRSLEVKELPYSGSSKPEFYITARNLNRLTSEILIPVKTFVEMYDKIDRTDVGKICLVSKRYTPKDNKYNYIFYENSNTIDFNGICFTIIDIFKDENCNEIICYLKDPLGIPIFARYYDIHILNISTNTQDSYISTQINDLKQISSAVTLRYGTDGVQSCNPQWQNSYKEEAKVNTLDDIEPFEKTKQKENLILLPIKINY